MNRPPFRSAARACRSLAILATAAGMTACASADHPEGQVYDPWEGYNRSIFSFNEGFDKYVMKPVTKGYVAVVPEYGRERVHNVLSNLNQPVIFLNSVLQGDPQNAFSSLWSFILNSTLGIAGIFDFTGTNTDLRVHPEDFGQTMGVWGVGSGPYFMLPILGPSTVRDTGGFAVDVVSDPFNYLNEDIVITRTILRAIDARAGLLLQTLDDVYKTSLDPYATLRSGYFQRRAALIKNRATTGPLAKPGDEGGETQTDRGNTALADPVGTDPAAQAYGQ